MRGGAAAGAVCELTRTRLPYFRRGGRACGGCAPDALSVGAPPRTVF
jgi:hypothetical protein